MTSLNSHLERNVPTVKAAVILSEWGSPSLASLENYLEKPKKIEINHREMLAVSLLLLLSLQTW